MLYIEVSCRCMGHVAFCISFYVFVRSNSELKSSFIDSTNEASRRFEDGIWKSLTETKPYISKESAIRRHGWDETYRKPRSPNLSRSQTPTPQRKQTKMQRTLSVDNIVLDLPAYMQKQASKLSENVSRYMVFDMLFSLETKRACIPS